MKMKRYYEAIDIREQNEIIDELYASWSEDSKGYSLFSDYLESLGIDIEEY